MKKIKWKELAKLYSQCVGYAYMAWCIISMTTILACIITEKVKSIFNHKKENVQEEEDCE